MSFHLCARKASQPGQCFSIGFLSAMVSRVNRRLRKEGKKGHKMEKLKPQSCYIKSDISMYCFSTCSVDQWVNKSYLIIFFSSSPSVSILQKTVSNFLLIFELSDFDFSWNNTMSYDTGHLQPVATCCKLLSSASVAGPFNGFHLAIFQFSRPFLSSWRPPGTFPSRAQPQSESPAAFLA